MDPASTAHNSLFQHDPLMLDGSTFRLVQIFPGLYDDPIHCEFLEVPISAEPNYYALSYAWGSPKTTAYVRCRGRDLAVGYNLEKAIRRIRDPLEFRSFWIDALCIDQRDDTGEKTTQIPLMRRIYQQASKVIIYLGEEQDGSEKIPALCESIKRAYETIPTPSPLIPVLYEGMKEAFNTVPISSQLKIAINQELVPRIEIGNDRLADFGFPSSDSKDWEMFPRLLSRPWFSRIWIIQEAILSTSAEIICGSWAMEWSDLVQAIIRSTRISIPISPNEILRGGRKSTEYQTATSALNFVLYMDSLGASQSDFKRLKCIDLMCLFRSSVTTMPQDYCYGILGIAVESGHPDLQVDYTLPVEEVYSQFTRFFIRNGHGVQVLYNANRYQPTTLPSWIPNWSQRHTTKTHALFTTDGLGEEKALSAATSYASSIKLHQELSNVLVVRGIVVDSIETIGSCPLAVENKPRMNFIDDADYRLVADCLVELYQLVRDRPNPVQPPSEHEERIIMNTLTGGNPNVQPNRKRLSPGYLYRGFLILLQANVPGWLVPHSLDSDLLAPTALFDMESIPQDCSNLLFRVYDQCYDKRRGRTERSYVGQFSHLTQVGDLVFLPLGSGVPFTIRLKDDGTYELLGDCYVHGIMNGEAFNLKGVVEEDILLS